MCFAQEDAFGIEEAYRAGALALDPEGLRSTLQGSIGNFEADSEPASMGPGADIYELVETLHDVASC